MQQMALFENRLALTLMLYRRHVLFHIGIFFGEVSPIFAPQMVVSGNRAYINIPTNMVIWTGKLVMRVIELFDVICMILF